MHQECVSTRIRGPLRLPECRQGSWYERVLEAMCRLRGKDLDCTYLAFTTCGLRSLAWKWRPRQRETYEPCALFSARPGIWSSNLRTADLACLSKQRTQFK